MFGRVVAAGLVVTATLVGGLPAAYADESPTPLASSTAPDAGTPSPSPATGSGEPSATVAPVPSASPSFGLPGLPSASPSASPAEPSASPTEDDDPERTALPGTDGVLPTAGYSDAYWAAYAAVERAEAELAAAQVALRTATQAQAAAAAAAAAGEATAGAAQGTAAAAQLAVDRLASELYRFGPRVTVVSAMLGAPDDFLAQVDTSHNQDLAAIFAARQADDAAAAAAIAKAQALTLRTRVEATSAALAGARSRLAAATKAVASARSRLAAAGGASAPQTTVGPDGCPKRDVAGTLRGGAEQVGARRLCAAAVAGAATPQAALAITWAFAHLGAAYACGGAGRMLPMRMDCSSLVSRAYAEGAGMRVAGATWAPSTRDMVPWGGAALDPHYAYVAPADLRPGDLVLYDTGGATYRHVVIYLGPAGKDGPAYMLHTNACGDVAKVEPFWGFPTTGSATFLVARRVIPAPGDPQR